MTGVEQQVAAEERPIRPAARPTVADRVFRGMSTAAALVSFAIVASTLVFLAQESRPALRRAGVVKFFTTSVWNPAVGKLGVGGLLIGTVIIATIALVIAVPASLAMALFINEYAPARVRGPVVSVIDLLAALPSILFGMWGFFALDAKLIPIAAWLSDHLSPIPYFRLSSPEASLAQSSFIAGVVVALMIVPIITSVCRDVMAQVPREQCEGALALGGTRWGMIRNVIFPFGKNGIIAAVFLGFGRALGETIAIAIIVVLTVKSNPHVLQRGAGSIAAWIAVRFGESSPLERSGLVAAGLALFVLTLVVTLLARTIVNRTGKVPA